MWIRNSKNPEHPGTIIEQSISSNGNFRFITVDGPFIYLEVEEKQAGFIQTLIEEQAKDYPDPFEYSRIARHERAQLLIQESVFEVIEPSLRRWGEKHSNDLLICDDIFKS